MRATFRGCLCKPEQQLIKKTMERELRFRVWDTEEKRMGRKTRTIRELVAIANQIPETVDDGKTTVYMDYIGRKDILGQYIFEGDIVDVESTADGLTQEMKDGIYVVKYSVIDCAFVLEQLDGKSGVCFDECMQLTVVGNIYENPELLTK